MTYTSSLRNYNKSSAYHRNKFRPAMRLVAQAAIRRNIKIIQAKARARRLRAARRAAARTPYHQWTRGPAPRLKRTRRQRGFKPFSIKFKGY